MGCGASADAVRVAELQKQLSTEEQKHKQELKKLKEKLKEQKEHKENPSPAKNQATPSDDALADAGIAEPPAPPPPPPPPPPPSKSHSNSKLKKTPSAKAAPEESKKATSASARDDPTPNAISSGGKVHVTVSDLVDKFVEDSGVKSQLAAAIIELLPPAAAAGDLEAAQSALRDTPKERFVEFTTAATQRIADSMASKAADLAEKHQASRSAEEVNSKYAMEDGMVEGAFGDVNDFLKGVEGIGLPQPEPLKGMQFEFLHGPDAEVTFKTSNYNSQTNPIVEWDFVTSPFDEASVQANPTGPRSAWTWKHQYSGNRTPMRLRVLLYAVSAKGSNGLCYDNIAGADKVSPGHDLYLTAEEKDLVKVAVLRFAKAQLDGRSLAKVMGEVDEKGVDNVRKMLKKALSDREFTYDDLVKSLQSHLSEKQLSQLIEQFRARLAIAGLSEMEVIAMRLYTGPPFLKVNSVLRAWSGKFPKSMTEHLRGNKYINTIHVAVSGLTKLQKVCVIPVGRKSYRGMAGVDFGFMSTTTEKEVAIAYIPTNKQLPIIFEIELGCIDRGSSLSFLSQYPEEDEILFPPLSYLETTGSPYMETTLKGDVIMMPARVNCNLKGKTVEEVAARRKEEHLSMRDYLGKEMKRDLERLAEVVSEAGLLSSEQLKASFDKTKTDLERLYDAELEGYRQQDATWFNRDDNYKRCITGAIDFKAGCIAQLLAVAKLPLHDLAKGKEVEGLEGSPSQLLEEVLKLGADPELKEESDLKTLLHVACEEDQVEMVKVLIADGASLEAKDQSYKQTPLLFAAERGAQAIVTELLVAGANIDATDDLKYNAMHKAANGSHPEVIQSLIVGKYKQSGPKGVQAFVNSRESSMWTPLMHACCAGSVETAKVLLDNKADVSLVDSDKKTCLHHAAESGSDDAVALCQLLLKHKADPNALDKNKEFPLHGAAQCGGPDLVKLFLDLDPAKINVKTKKGETCLHMAACSNLEVSALLLERGADCMLKDKDGKLPSKIAKESDEFRIAKMLKAKENGEDWEQFRKKKSKDEDEDEDEEDEEEEEKEEKEEEDGKEDSNDDW